MVDFSDNYHIWIEEKYDNQMMKWLEYADYRLSSQNVEFNLHTKKKSFAFAHYYKPKINLLFIEFKDMIRKREGRCWIRFCEAYPTLQNYLDFKDYLEFKQNKNNWNDWNNAFKGFKGGF